MAMRTTLSILGILFMSLLLTSLKTQFKRSLDDVNIKTTPASELLKQYSEELSAYDIEYKNPDSFKPFELKGKLPFNEYIDSAYQASPVSNCAVLALESADSEALVLFPEITYGIPIFAIKDGETIEENLRWRHRDPALDVSPMVEIISKDDMADYANSDTAAIYSFELQKPVMNKFNYCVGIYLRKYAHPFLALKIVMTPEGFKNKDKYIRLLLDSLKYGQANVPEYVEAEKKMPAKDLNFPSPSMENNFFWSVK